MPPPAGKIRDEFNGAMPKIGDFLKHLSEQNEDP
jgi:hypothetical protein